MDIGGKRLENGPQRKSLRDGRSALAAASGAATSLPQVEDGAEERPNAWGLSTEEAQSRLRDVGYNEIAPETKVPLVVQFLRHLWGPIPWMIEGAAALALVLRAWGTVLVVLSNLLLNAAVAFFEEYRANSAVAALKRQLAPQATVRRDGEWVLLAARELVPDDLILLKLGDIVPADATVCAGGHIDLDRATLTGESLPVPCEAGETAHAGCVVVSGECTARVTATGKNVAFSRTVELVQSRNSAGHLSHLVISLNNVLLIGALVLSMVNVCVSVLRAQPLTSTLEFALLLLVAAIPASMPTVLSVTLAAGAQRLARKRALTTRIEAIEELAGMDVLCADKTGTLTQNLLSAGEPVCFGDASCEEVILDAALACAAHGRDAIDTAIWSKLPETLEISRYDILRFSPYDPVSKRSEALVSAPDGQSFSVTKGALQVVLSLAAENDAARQGMEQAAEALALRGYRSLAVARKQGDGTWTVEGIIPLFDPVREDASDAVRRIQDLGVRISLLTGDQLPIAVEIARRVGLGTHVIAVNAGTALDARIDAGRVDIAEGVDGVAQVLPEHKFTIVQQLQENGHVVGMLGDGVNDTPALRKADIGISVSGAGDAVRRSADLVLLAPGLGVIADAIQTSRQVYERMHTYVVYRVSETLRRMLSMVLASAVFLVYPLTPAMLGLLATLNGIVLIALAYDRVRIPDAPTRWHTSRLLLIAGALGFVGIFEFFGLLYLCDVVFAIPHSASQTALYLGISLAGHLTLLVTRTRRAFWSLAPSAVLLGSIVIAQILATLVALFGVFMAPVTWQLALVIWIWSLAWFLVEDNVKLGMYVLLDRRRR